MPKKITPYKSVEFKFRARVVLGVARVASVEALKGVKLLRVTDEGRDDLCIDGPQILPGTEVPWSNVTAAIRDLDPPKPEPKKDA